MKNGLKVLFILIRMVMRNSKPYQMEPTVRYVIEEFQPKSRMDVFWVKHPGQDPVALAKISKRFLILSKRQKPRN